MPSEYRITNLDFWLSEVSMNNVKETIRNCTDVLQGNYNSLSRTEISEAEQLLKALDYLPGVPDEVTDPITRENRLALLTLAARCDDLFSLDMPNAPGAFFFGAKFKTDAFDIDGHGLMPIGVAGRGLSFGQAFESCIGETAEYLSFIERKNDPLVVKSCSSAQYQKPMTDWIHSGLGIRSDEDLATFEKIEARSLHSEKTIALPLELVLRRSESKRKAVRTAHSNGVAAGVSLSTATTAGTLELIERDAMVLWWYGGNAAKSITNGAVWGTEFLSFVSTCRQGSSRDCWFLEITSDIPVPVIAAFSSRVDGSVVVGGFAADPDPLRAATRAFLEMCQMELAQQISTDKQSYLPAGQLSAQDRIWIERERQLSLENFPRLKKATTVEECAVQAQSVTSDNLAEAISVAGLEAFLVDLTRPEIGIPTVRVIVPGLQGTDRNWVSARLSAVARDNNLTLQVETKTMSPF